MNRALAVAGLKLERINGTPGATAEQLERTAFKAGIDRIKASPLDPRAYLEHGRTCLAQRKEVLAFALARSASFLGGDRGECEELAMRAKNKAPVLETLSHNVYYRMYTLARAIEEFQGPDKASVIDIGGGSGHLAMFLPDHPYFLVEPNGNGISGQHLPFPKENFDFAVSCHVLEHIPKEGRWEFLDSLLAQSRKGVILLNPYELEGSYDRLNLVWEISKASWSKEHMDCVMPHIDDVREYARARQLECIVRPNTNIHTSFAVFWMDHLAARHKDTERMQRVNHFMNTHMLEGQDSEKYPTAYLVYLKKPSGY